MTYNRVQKTTPAAKLKEKPERKERDGERESERGKNPKKKKENPKEGNWVPGGGASQPTSHPKRKNKKQLGSRENYTERERERERERALFTNLFI
jgi:hypothetical protein